MNKLSGEKFFDVISVFYDEMINFSSSLEKRINAFNKFLTPEMRSAADLGCGTGLDSIALSKLGLHVTGFDISTGMINKAKKNSEIYKCNIEFHKSGLHQISSKFKNNFDIAFSLGNTMANLNKIELQIAIKKIYGILSHNGLFVMQILNFNLIRKNNNRILKISKDSNNFIIRFFDIFKNNFNLNALSFNSFNPDENKLLTTKIYPYSAMYLESTLKKAGFKNLKLFGDLNLSKFLNGRSNDLIIACNKQN